MRQSYLYLEIDSMTNQLTSILLQIYSCFDTEKN